LVAIAGFLFKNGRERMGALPTGRKKKFTKIAPRAVATAAAAVFIFIAASCDDAPIYARSSSWYRAARRPYATSFEAVAEAADGYVYAVGYVVDYNYGWYPVVCRYDGREFKEVYRAPYTYGDFHDVKAWRNTVWAAGGGNRRVAMRPVLVRFSGGVWQEIGVPAAVDDEVFKTVFPTGPDSCWVAGWNGIYTYDRGVWNKRFRKTSPGGLIAIGPRDAFVYMYKKKEEAGAVFVTDDGGSTWAEERVDLGSKLYRFDPGDPWVVMGGVGGKLYLAVALRPHEPPKGNEYLQYYAILSREPALPGEGVYEIEMLAPKGAAEFNYLTPAAGGMAFRSRQEGFLVSIDTSLALVNGKWVPEELGSPGPWGYYQFEAVAPGRSNYWAVVTEIKGWPREFDYYLYRTR